MTGKVGPEIDIARLLIAPTINDDNEIAFTHSALSALQKIIDCRDNIYMWVCNHHTVVYTDYLYQECFKHFNNLSVSGKLFTEALPYSKLFSREAIGEKCVDDNDALHYIKKAMWSVKEGKCESNYTKNIVTQLENRNYLKPTWKTLFEFDKYLRLIKDTFDDKKRKKILKYVTENIDNRKIIVKYSSRSRTSSVRGGIFPVIISGRFAGLTVSCKRPQ